MSALTRRRIRLGALALCPIHYQAPLYRAIAAHPAIDFEVIFASSHGARPFDGGFGQEIVWAADLLGGYRHRFLRKHAGHGSLRSIFSYCDLDVFHVVLQARYDALWLHGYQTPTHVLASISQRLRRGEVLYREEQTLLNRRSSLKTTLKSIGLPVLFSGAAGMYIGSENKRWFKRFGIPEQRLFFTPYCVDNDSLRAQATSLRPQREKLRREFGLPRDRPVVVTVCRLVPKKSVQTLIEAAALLRDQVECSFLVVGSGPEQAKLMTFAERLGLDNVVFAGFLNQNEIARGFVVSDVFVLPSTKDETWGLVVNEAMNFGLPVVVSNQVGCATDLVHLGENGYIFRAGDAENLADYLAPLLTDASLRERFGLRSRELVGEWSYERAAHGVLEAVHAVVGDQAWRHAAPAHELISAQPLGGPAYDYVGDQQKGDQ